MSADDPELHELARAIDEGTSVDWASTESNAGDETARRLIRELSVIAAISDVHSSAPLVESHSPSTAPSVEDSTAIWGAFRLLEKIGEGAHGEVYRAWDTRLDREVALKLLPPGLDEASRATSIIEEGRLLARVRHPNVVTIYGAERVENRIGLWMELVKGQTLEQILERGALSSAETTTIGLEVCRAVSAVHGAGLLHRDIKTHNVMRSEDGRIVLMDFGTGRPLDDDARLDLAGTPLYLAPEILQGQRATVRTDLYSLGVLLYHLVTRSYPVHARTIRELRDRHERGERTAVGNARRDVPLKLARVITRAIDRRPECRQESADELAAELAALQPRSKHVRLTLVAAVVAAVFLVAGLGWEAMARQTGSSRRPSAWLMSVSGTPAERPVIAVLPFENLSADPESGYFADGLTNEIIRNLAPVQGLRVVSSTTSFAFKNQPRNLQQIREQLGANHIIEGSVLRTGNRLRINARLVTVVGDVALWAEEFDRPIGDIFSIHTEISRALVNRLQLRSSNQREQYKASFEAYDWYLKGRELVDRRGGPSAGQAAEFFEHAIATDPNFAPAHAGPNAYAFLSFPNRGSVAYAKAYPIMRRAAATALQLDPLLADAHMAMGWVHAYQRDWQRADASFKQAIHLDPSLTQAYTSYSVSTLQPLQRYDDALQLLHEAATRDPLSLDVLREIGEVQLFAGRYAEAIEMFQRVRYSDPDFPFIQTYLARALIFGGRGDEAIALWQPSAIWTISALVRSGKRAEAETLVAEHRGHPYRMAVISAVLGDTHGAVEAIEQVADTEPQRIGRLLIDPDVAAVRDHPRVVAVRKAFNLP